MAYSMVLKLTPEIKGESSTTGYIGQIELISWNFGVSNGVHFDSGKKLQLGTVNVDAIVVRKANDASTPALMNLSASGKSGKPTTGVITVLVSGDPTPKPHLTITMENLIVASVAVQCSGEMRPEDTVTFFFSKVSFQYENIDAKGTAQTKPKFTYDLEAQKTMVT
jgi:type VI secretion system secreted protein Hcp